MERMSPRSVRSAVVLVAALALGVVACVGPTGTPSPAPSSAAPAASASLSTRTDAPSASPSASVAPSEPFDPAAVSVELESVVEGLSEPLAVVNAGDGSGRLFIAEQGGRIQVVHDGQLAAEALLDIGDRISSGGERGLLGLAFHPNFPEDPRLFVDYTDRSGNTVVSSFAIDLGNPGRADPDSETPILAIEQPYPNHNGGALAFGPDGFLYVSTGDGGSGGDPHGNGQSLETLLGKILRIDIDTTDGDRAYSIPADNPFVGRDGARPEIWLTGLRNPWRMSFDRGTEDLWIGDVGQGSWEEVDVARATAGGGANYGWNRMEGSHCFKPADGCRSDELILPVTEYGHDEGCTVIGGNVYRGSEQPLLIGGYLFADYCSGRIWAIDAASDGPTKPTLVAESGATLSSFGEDEDGELYATDLASGQLYRVRATAR
jgi:glucose/arabinose dehydrogenase